MNNKKNSTFSNNFDLETISKDKPTYKGELKNLNRKLGGKEVFKVTFDRLLEAQEIYFSNLTSIKLP